MTNEIIEIDRKTRTEKDAIASVKGLAKGVLLIALLQLAVGALFVSTGDVGFGVFVGSIVIGMSAIFFVLGWFLLKKKSYRVALGLVILTGINLTLNVVGAVAVAIAGDGFQPIPRVMISIVFFLVSFKGMNAAETLKEIRVQKISPDVVP